MSHYTGTGLKISPNKFEHFGSNDHQYLQMSSGDSQNSECLQASVKSYQLVVFEILS